jgi:hypothetical protein
LIRATNVDAASIQDLWSKSDVKLADQRNSRKILNAFYCYVVCTPHSVTLWQYDNSKHKWLTKADLNNNQTAQWKRVRLFIHILNERSSTPAVSSHISMFLSSSIGIVHSQNSIEALPSPFTALIDRLTSRTMNLMCRVRWCNYTSQHELLASFDHFTNTERRYDVGRFECIHISQAVTRLAASRNIYVFFALLIRDLHNSKGRPLFSDRRTISASATFASAVHKNVARGLKVQNSDGRVVCVYTSPNLPFGVARRDSVGQSASNGLFFKLPENCKSTYDR